MTNFPLIPCFVSTFPTNNSIVCQNCFSIPMIFQVLNDCHSKQTLVIWMALKAIGFTLHSSFCHFRPSFDSVSVFTLSLFSLYFSLYGTFKNKVLVLILINVSHAGGGSPAKPTGEVSKTFNHRVILVQPLLHISGCIKWNKISFEKNINR